MQRERESEKMLQKKELLKDYKTCDQTATALARSSV
jgi:hypothetical protein